MRIIFALPELAGLSGGLRVAAQYAAHLSGPPRKNAGVSIAALERLHTFRPEIRALPFGIMERLAPLPEWIVASGPLAFAKAALLRTARRAARDCAIGAPAPLSVPARSS